MNEVRLEPVSDIEKRARTGYRMSNPGSCDKQREAACIDVLALAARVQAVERENAAIKATVGDTEFSLRQQLAEAQARVRELEATQVIPCLPEHALAELRDRYDTLFYAWHAQVDELARVTAELAEVQATLAERERAWTKDKPTKPGWYFYRRDQCVDICRVQQFDIDENTFRHSRPCEWAGPISLPIDTQSQRALRGE